MSEHNAPPTIQWGAPQPQPPKPQHRKGTGRVAIGIYAGLLGLMLGSAAAGGADTTTPVASEEPQPVKTVTVEVPGPTKTVTVAPKAPKAKPAAPAKPASAESFPGDGTYVVGTDIQPGTYRSKPADGQLMEMCYWSRLSSLSGEMGSILANDIAKGQTTVTILPGDKAFETKGCDEWVKVG